MIAVAMLSLAGIPPLPGFVAKFLIFKNVMAAGYTTYAVLGLVGSYLGIYFYLRVIQLMFMSARDRAHAPASPRKPDAQREPRVLPAVDPRRGIPGLGDGHCYESDSMYKRILIPTDGSKVARKGIKAGVALAKTRGREHRRLPRGRAHRAHLLHRGLRRARGAGEGDREAAARARRGAISTSLRNAAAAAGVPCETLITNPAGPYQGIIDAATPREMRRHLHGLARPGPDRVGAPRQRHAQGADAQQGAVSSAGRR